MKRKEREKALQLRKEGNSIGDIARIIGVSKASVSLWVRNIVLTQVQQDRLTKNGFSISAIEKRRVRRIAGTQARRRAVMDNAKGKIETISKHELLLIGTALYWGEGGKTERGMARVSNSDPGIIRMMMRFFREVAQVPEEKFRGHVHTFSHANTGRAERYWSTVSGIPRKQFYKTYEKPSISSKGLADKLPFGTFQIYVCDTALFYTIKGYIERLTEMGG